MIAGIVDGWMAAVGGRDWTRQSLERYQFAHLRALTQESWNRVPFYRRKLEAAGMRWDDIRSLEDLANLPQTGRAEIRDADPSELLARGADERRLCTRLSSGTTGPPLRILRTPVEERLLHAFRLRVMFGYGMRWRDRRWSVRIAHAGRSEWWTRLGLLRVEKSNVFEDPAALAARFAALRPNIVEGYASGLAGVADQISSRTRAAFRPKFVAAGAEPVRPDIRERIQKGFGCRVYDVYGSNEANLLAWECPDSGLLHVNEAAVILEILRDGRPVAEGEIGEVVITALHSRTMPFIRYAIGDMACRGPRPCPCGAPLATIHAPEFRSADIFTFGNGRRFVPHLLVRTLRERHGWVRQFQLVQERQNQVRLKVAAPPELTDIEERLGDWLRLLRAHCGEEVRIEVERVASIPLGANGKYRGVVSCVAPGEVR
jgi:phenylacetate-CoA ligase